MMGLEVCIPNIIDLLYEGALDETAWSRALIGIADLVSGAAVFLFCINPSTGTILRDEFHRFSPEAFADYRKYWFTKDIRVAPALKARVGTPIFESKLMPIKQWRTSEIFNEYLMPEDSPWFLVFLLNNAADRVVSLSIQRTQVGGPFDERDGECIQSLIPHVRRALEIKDRLESANMRCNTLSRSMNNLSFGILLLDAGGRVLEASATAAALMRADNGIRRNPDGTLWLRAQAGVELSRWLATGAPPEHNRDGFLHVPRSLANPLSILVTRLPLLNTPWFGGGQPCWMLMLFDPDRRLSLSTELIASDLGISGREAEVAALLFAGYDIKTLAARLSISVHTARTHVKAVFSRTGIRSQAELIRRIAGGPAMIQSSK